jgi:hypothetical protein
LPTASIFTESSEEIFPTEWHFVTKLGPQVSPFPVPIFGVNTGEPNRMVFHPTLDLLFFSTMAQPKVQPKHQTPLRHSFSHMLRRRRRI